MRRGKPTKRPIIALFSSRAWLTRDEVVKGADRNSRPAGCHFGCDRGFVGIGQYASSHWKHHFVLNPDVLLVDRGKLGHCLTEAIGLRFGKTSLSKAALAQLIYLGVQRISAVMLLLKRFKSADCGFHIRMLKLAQARK